jgi:hypothetical protein
MKSRAHLLVALGLFVGALRPLSADTVWLQRTGGEEEVCAHDVLVVEEGAAFARYRRLDGEVIVYDRCDAARDKGESIRIVKSSSEERRAIFHRWAALGHTAEVTDRSGKRFTVFNLALQYVAPKGFAWAFGHSPRPEPTISIHTGPGVEKADFSDVQTISVQEDGIAVLLRNGRELSGRIDAEYASGTALIPKLKGLEDLGSEAPVEFELLVSQVATIAFKAQLD